MKTTNRTPSGAFSADLRRFSAFLMLLGLGLGSLTRCQAQSGMIDHFTWSDIPTETRVDRSFSVTLEARDSADMVVTQYHGSVSISGLVASSPPAIMISEVETLYTERVEISNLSEVPVDVSNWRVVFYDSKAWPTPRIIFKVPFGSICPPHSVFEVGSGGEAPGTFPVFRLGIPYLYWGAGGDFPFEAALLLDENGKVVDFFCAKSAYPSMIKVPDSIPESEWTGQPAEINSNPGLTYQRIGILDHNNVSDWIVRQTSFGRLNDGLSVPLLALPMRHPVVTDYGETATLSGGIWSGELLVPKPTPSLTLRADDLLGHTGDSTALKVLDNPPLGIQLPAEAFEATSGFVGFGSIAIQSLLGTNVEVRLTSDDTNEILVPPKIVITAGSTSGLFSITNLPDGLLDGPKRVTVRASAVGFADASGSITNYDADGTGLTLQLPPSARESDGWISNGLVTIGGTAFGDITVHLESSDTLRLQLPPTVTIPLGSNSAMFNLRLLDDGRITASQSITVTANVPGWPIATAMIEVTDIATTELQLHLPDQVLEGSGVLSNAGEVSISGTLTTNLALALNDTLSARLQLPSTIMIPAGQTSAVFSITVPDDSEKQGATLLAVTCSAPGFTTAHKSVTVLDNDIDHLAFNAISSPQFLGEPFAVKLRAVAVDETTVPGVSQSAELTIRNGTTTPSARSVSLFDGAWTGMVTVVSGSTNVMLTATSSDGLIGDTNPFKVLRPAVRQLSLPTKDLVYDPVTARIYSTVPANGGVYSNSLVRVDPVAGTIENARYLGPDPNQIAATDDGHYLYVGVDGESTVRRFNLEDQDLDGFFSIGEGLYALDLEVMPGNGERVAVSRSQFEPFGPVGISIYDHGIRLTNDASGPSVITFGSSNVLYGYWNYTTEFGFYRMLVDDNGVHVLNSSGPLIQGYADIEYDADRLLTTLGSVLDPDNLKVLGQLPVGGIVESDSALNRIYVLFQDSGIWRLGAFDRTTLASCGRLDLNGVAGTPSSLTRWGTNGLAFRTSADQIFLVETELVPQVATADLGLQLGSDSQHVLPGSVVTFDLAVTNKGSTVATGVMIQNSLPDGTVLESTTSSQGTCILKENVVVCLLGTLAPRESASVHISLRSSNLGYVTNSALASLEQLDPCPADNGDVCVVSVVPALEPFNVDLRILSAADLVWNPARQRLYVTVKGDDPHWGNRLIQMNPFTGGVDSAWFLGSDPGLIVASSDSHYLYVTVNRGNRVVRFDLDTKQSDHEFDLDLGLSAGDLTALTGRPESIAINSGETLVFDNADLRFRAPIGFFIQSGEDSMTLYHYGTGPWSNIKRYRLGSTSATLDTYALVHEGELSDFHYDAGLILTPPGDVLYGPTVTPVGFLTNLSAVNPPGTWAQPSLRQVLSDAADGRVFHLWQSGKTASPKTSEVRA